MNRHRQAVRPLAALASVVAVAVVSTSCGSSAKAPSSPSPRPAVSVTVIPGLSQADMQQDSAAHQAAVEHLVTVFLKDSATPSAVQELARQIAAMPEVEAYHFVTKDEALANYKAQLGPDGDAILKNLSRNPLPASFQILVRDPAEVAAVVDRFQTNPIVYRATAATSLLSASPPP